MIDLSTRLARREGILAQQVEGTQVLLNLTDGQYYALDEVGCRVWELCDGRRTLADIADVLGQEFEAPVPTIAADVLELVRELADAQLVVGAG